MYIGIHETAISQFKYEFSSIFNRRLKRLSPADEKTISLVSQKIWNSKMVQQSEDCYGVYKKCMTEFFIGTHIVFRDDDRSFFKALDEGSLERNSSHYGKVGSHKQRHIMGSALPETLFFKGHLGLCNGQIKAGKYWKHLPEEHKQQHTPIKVVWIQAENTPDGPNFFDWLYHRTIDFVVYFVLKNVLKSERPQIGPYTTKEGLRGLPDTSPLFIE